MASKDNSGKRRPGESCVQCRKVRRRCRPYQSAPHSCWNCHKKQLECSLLSIASSSPVSTKRKNEEIQDTPDSDSIRSNRATSSATAPYHPPDTPSTPIPKKGRGNVRSEPQPDAPELVPYSNKRRILKSGVCGICLSERCYSEEKKGDTNMLVCDIECCGRWYHLSCVLFEKPPRQIFFSLATGTRDSTFICEDCLCPQREDLVETFSNAIADFQSSIERVKKDVRPEEDSWLDTISPDSPKGKGNTSMLDHEVANLQPEASTAMDFELSRVERYQGFETEKIKVLLSNIEEAIYNYDREICWAIKLFSDGNDLYMKQPLKVWNLIDPNAHLVEGEEWFRLSPTANTRNLSQSHAPVTAALRRMLNTPDDKPLQIPSDLEDLEFSEVHKALINWFVFDIINNELNIYHSPNMKPLRAMLSAVANFGDARCKGSGRQVLREVQLRAWHKDGFREEVIENEGWQGDLIRHLEEFLQPLTTKVGRIEPWSCSRAAIIKGTIELWTYLDACRGRVEVFAPDVGAQFDGKVCESVDEDWQHRIVGGMTIRWVASRGFKVTEDGLGGIKRAMTKKAAVVVG